jgi:hypothetical protein
MGMTAYRCYLPVLTGLAGSHCAGPDHHRHVPLSIARRRRCLNREFNPAGADCGYRAPLPPRLARSPNKYGGDDRIRTDDPLVANEVLSQLSYIPTCCCLNVPARNGTQFSLAERGGFEPPEQQAAQRFSRPSHSTTLASLRADRLFMDEPPSSRRKWRRERDSNPRWDITPTHDFQSCRFSQLSHLSARRHSSVRCRRTRAGVPGTPPPEPLPSRRCGG